MQSILTFQRRFLRAAFAPGVEIAAMSLPRGNAKSTLAARLLARSMRPGSRLFVPGADNKLIAGSFQQARVVFRLLRAELGEEGYRYEDSNQSYEGFARRHADAGAGARRERENALRIPGRQVVGGR